jgi:peptide/nickel transport system permease protein
LSTTFPSGGAPAAAPVMPDVMPTRIARKGIIGYIFRNPTIAIGGFLLLLLIFVAVFAPFLWTKDPTALAPAMRTRAPGGSAPTCWGATFIPACSTAPACR